MGKLNKIDLTDFDFNGASVIYKSIYNPEKTICLFLNDYSDKEHFQLALDETLMQDGENIYTFDCYQEVPECFIENDEVMDKFWEFLQALVEANEANQEDAFIAYLNQYYSYEYVENIDFDEAVYDCNDKYHGHWDSEVEFAEHMAKCYGLDDNLGSLAMYFDYKAFARDLFINDYDFVDGYVFATY